MPGVRWDTRDSFKEVFPISELGDSLTLLEANIMQNKFATVAAAFVPLGFIGGLSQGGIWLGIASAIFWAIVFLVVRPKN